MARGWESKEIESQQEAAEQRRAQARPSLTPEQLARQRERESLELSRTRVLRDLQTVRSPHYRASLEGALRHLDEKLAALRSEL